MIINDSITKVSKLDREQLNRVTKRYIEELEPWFPKNIYDVHTHVGLFEHQRNISPERFKGLAVGTCINMNFNILERELQAIFTKSQIKYTAFPFPRREMEIARVNDYVMQSKRPIILGDLQNPHETEILLKNDYVVGLKIYSDFVNKPYDEIRISDFLPDRFAASLNKHKKSLMLHVPLESLADEPNMSYVENLGKRYPQMKIILAHMGQCHIGSQMKKIVRRLSKIPNAVMDTSTVTNVDVYSYALDEVGPQRILYGSDFPFSHVTGNIMEIGNEAVYITNGVYSWTRPALKQWRDQNNPDLTFLIYHQLFAMKQAFERVGTTRTEKEDIFYNNAANLFGIE